MRTLRAKGTIQATLSIFFQHPAIRLCVTMPQMTRWSFLLLMFIGLWSVADKAYAQPMDDSRATTEQSCSFGMEKGEASQRCHIPFPTGCLVAHVPGSDKPWTTISKGGNTFCRFDDKASDWKTRITGSCTHCKSDHCSVQFVVRFDCSNQVH